VRLTSRRCQNGGGRCRGGAAGTVERCNFFVGLPRVVVEEHQAPKVRAMVARKFKVDDREPLPALAAPLPSIGTGEELALLALSSIRGVGYWTLSRMAKAGVGFAVFLETDDSAEASRALKSFGAKLENKMAGEWQAVRDRALARAIRVIEDLRATGTRVVMAKSPEFPRALDDLSDPPAWLFVQGDLPLLSKPSVAAVGTRAPSDDGLWLCRFVGLCFESWGAPTVSGLAVGIDHVVHELSLRAKAPTIAVLGTGIFSDYPKGAVALRERILSGGGAIVTEYLPYETYSAENFVRRNRLQAALAHVLIPIEWASRSGTAHTVRYAATLRRPIAGLRLPDWPKERVAFSDGAAATARTFTIPGQEDQFRRFVADSLSPRATAHEPEQSSFLLE
jgi:DNA processing protein